MGEVPGALQHWHLHAESERPDELYPAYLRRPDGCLQRNAGSHRVQQARPGVDTETDGRWRVDASRRADYRFRVRPAGDSEQPREPDAGSEPWGMDQPAILPDRHAESSMGGRDAVGAGQRPSGHHREPDRRPVGLGVPVLPSQQLPVRGLTLVDAGAVHLRTGLQLHDLAVERRIFCFL